MAVFLETLEQGELLLCNLVIEDVIREVPDDSKCRNTLCVELGSNFMTILNNENITFYKVTKLCKSIK